jgi:hypothetical protein
VFGMGTGVTSSLWSPGKNPSQPNEKLQLHRSGQGNPHREERKKGQTSRLISTGKLNPSRGLHLQPIKVVVFNLPSGPNCFGQGDLVLEEAWHLDAFSAYPFRT